MSEGSEFAKIAVLGAGTMGSGIAAQIANAGLEVLLLDLPARPGLDKSPAERAIDRLLASEPPQLMQADFAGRITVGSIEDDFDQLAGCDLIIEAVVEQLDLKKQLYARLDKLVSEDCIITSNTSTIPVRLLTEDLPEARQRRFAITHYFNPVRFMRLLELVHGEKTDSQTIDRLARFNDQILGKGVVRCADTPGFLGNRVGVFALQVGLHEALQMGVAIEAADALFSRPMGIPKTGIFGLYDLIGIDLMSDVAASLRSILPEEDAFQAVGHDPALMRAMIADGFTGNKGKGGFYRETENGRQVRIIEAGADGSSWRPVSPSLPDLAIKAAAAQARQQEALLVLLDDSSLHGQFARRVLARILCYAASLLGEVTDNPQDLDDAMKLGFNWQRGPFEMIDAIGPARLAEIATEAGPTLPACISAEAGPFYRANQGQLEIRRAGGLYQPALLPEGAFRLQMARQAMQPILSNHAASLYALEGDLRLVEFHSKANALTADSMQIVRAAAEDHGRGIIIHNDAQHFSAGVDLNAFRAFIEAANWTGIDAFLNDFQQAVLALKYAPVPVIGAPSGLALGGGFEVLAHCDRLAVHANSTLGLVESGVGLLPGGGGVKESFLRWLATGAETDKAAWNCWKQIGYGLVGTAPMQAARWQYFLPGRDIQVMNKDRLFAAAKGLIAEMQQSYRPPEPPRARLGSPELSEKMQAFMDEGVARGDFTAHNRTVAMMISTIPVRQPGDAPEVSEQELMDRERAGFVRLAQTAQTHQMISALLDGTASSAEDS